MREYKPYLVWILVVGGLLWGWEGLTGGNLLIGLLGSSVAMIVEVIVGIAAVLVAYLKLTKPGKKK